MSQTVAAQLVGVLEQIGVKHIFGLIGDSLNPLADEVRRSQIEWIGVRHEEGAALAAAGQARSDITLWPRSRKPFSPLPAGNGVLVFPRQQALSFTPLTCPHRPS
jgi:hypothetical protein